MRRAIIALWWTLAASAAQADATVDADAVLDFAPAPGSYVQVGDHRLHLYCKGEGSPAVVFDSGLGGSSLDWSKVQPDVATLTRACVYDRAGYGWSDPGPNPRSSATIVAELEELLGRGGVAAPYVLVGHSFGGFNVRLFASEHPDQTAALVLIDSSHEQQFERFDEAGLPSIAPGAGAIIIGNPNTVPEALPDELRTLAQSFTLRAGFVYALRSELGNLRRSASELRAATALPDVPLIVISHRVRETGASARKDALWLDLQRDLATRTSRARLVMASTQDHYIQLSEPGIVVAAIRTVVDQTRSRGQQPSARPDPRT